MGFRLQRRIRLGKFIQLNISKSGVGFSAGIRGLRISRGPSGTWFTVGLPGTGLSYRKKLDSKVGHKQRRAASSPGTAGAAAKPALPDPGFFAGRTEKELVKGLEHFRAGNSEQALEYLLNAAPEEPGAAILAASILDKKDSQEYRATEMLERVVQSDDTFPTLLMKKYLAEAEFELEITPTITATVSVDALGATLLLVELYQHQRRVREAITLLEEIDELADEPVLTLSLCELYAARNLWEHIIERAKNTEPEDDITLGILTFYGRALQEKGLYEAANAIFTKALRRQKGRHPMLRNEVRYWRAISYQEQGKFRQANIEFQKLYAAAPDFRDVAARLAEFSLRP